MIGIRRVFNPCMSCIVVVAPMLLWASALAEPAKKAAKSVAQPVIEKAIAADSPPALVQVPVAGYCEAIRTLAASEQNTREKAEMQRLSAELESRTTDLERKLADIKGWVAKRDAFVSRAQDSVVQIYSKMLPEAAAVQLAVIAEDTAAAVLLRLEAKRASALMSEMEPAKAARLASLLALAGELNLASKAAVPRRDAAGRTPDGER
jgi:flagellar motility protein MotE (MotC chaperone)